MAAPKTIAVIDPAAGTPELDAFNALAQRSSALPVAFTYHLPALFGMGSLAQLEAQINLVFGAAALLALSAQAWPCAVVGLRHVREYAARREMRGLADLV